MKSSSTDLVLDTALEAWAKRHELSPLRAAAMREEILASESGQSESLSLQWWMKFSTKLNQTLQLSLDSCTWHTPNVHQLFYPTLQQRYSAVHIAHP